MGRLGQKVGKGYYRYEPGQRKPLLDPEVTALIESTSEAQGIKRRPMADAEVLDRLILPMINEGAKLIEEGIATRPSDIDVVWQKGFGWPSWKGGPMYYADQLGLAALHQRLEELEHSVGEQFRPARTLGELARNKRRFADLQKAEA